MVPRPVATLSPDRATRDDETSRSGTTLLPMAHPSSPRPPRRVEAACAGSGSAGAGAGGSTSERPDDAAVVGDPAHGGHLLAPWLERLELLARLEDSDLQHVVPAAGEQLLAIGLPVDGQHVVRVPLEGLQLLAVGDPRNLEELVRRGRRGQGQAQGQGRSSHRRARCADRSLLRHRGFGRHSGPYDGINDLRGGHCPFYKKISI
jgi:hypothetical protein